MAPPTNAAWHSRDILPILRFAEAWDAGSTSETYDPETLPGPKVGRDRVGNYSDLHRLVRPVCNALLTGGSFEGGANPTNSDLFRRVRGLLETTHCMQTAARRTSVQRDNSETRFSHWRRPHASIDHAAGAAAVGMFLRLRAA
jgi:hypothetical protein